MKHIEETIIKRRRTKEQIRETRQEQLEKKKAQIAKKRKKKFLFKRPESILKRFKRTHKHEVGIRKRFKQGGKFKVAKDPKTLFVVRIRDGKTCPRKIRETLKSLRLETFLSGRFVRNNKEMQDALRTIEPWVTFGYATPRTVQQLILRRGYAGVERDALKSNLVVEQNFGTFGLICLDDVVDALSVGSE